MGLPGSFGLSGRTLFRNSMQMTAKTGRKIVISEFMNWKSIFAASRERRNAEKSL
jgi:hypothetical protein